MDSLQFCRYVIIYIYIYIYCICLLKYISLVSLIIPHWFIQVPYMNRIWDSSAIQFSYIEQWLPCYMVIARRNDLLATVYTVTFIKITRKLPYIKILEYGVCRTNYRMYSMQNIKQANCKQLELIIQKLLSSVIVQTGINRK